MPKGIAHQKRNKIYSRDGFVCQYCGATPELSFLTVDHAIPKCEGGSNREENLKTACRDCNLMKGKRSVEWLRTHLSIKRSKYSGLLSVDQYFLLTTAGADFGLIEPYVFWFEMMEAHQ